MGHSESCPSPTLAEPFSAVHATFASIIFTPELAMAFSSRSVKSSEVKTALAESLGLSNGKASTAHLIPTGSG
jgi:hypothetical protein